MAMTIQTYQTMDAPLLFSEAAAKKVASLILEEGNPDLKLRVYISGGGCSGFQYAFMFDEMANSDDFIFEKPVIDQNTGAEFIVQLLVQAACLPYLQNAEIDYEENVQGAQFVIRNPNAKTTCGCGSSFGV